MSARNGTTEQPHGKNIPRRQAIPILYTKGTHYDVGFDVVIYIRFLFLISRTYVLKNESPSIKIRFKIIYYQ